MSEEPGIEPRNGEPKTVDGTMRIVSPSDGAPDPVAGLDIMDLATILQTLTANRRTGTLKVKGGRGDEKFVYFQDGLVRLVSTATPDRDLLAEALFKSGNLPRGRLEEMRAKSQATKKPLSMLLLQRSRLSKAETAALLTGQMTEEIADLFAWKDVHCEFFPDRLLDERLDPSLATLTEGLSADGILLETMRRADEWERIAECFDPEKEVFSLVASGPDVFADEAKRELASLIDGYRDVSEVVRICPLHRFSACMALKEMFIADQIRAQNTAQLAAAGDIAAAQADWAKALKLFQHAYELDAGRIDLLVKLAAAHEALGDIASAKEHLWIYASKNLAQSRFGEVARTCRHLVELDPEDVEPRARLFHALRETGDRGELRTAGMGLALAYEKKGAVDRAAGILGRLLDLFPEDEEVREVEARIRLASAERIEALAEYEELAESYLERGDLEGAIRAFRRILEDVDEECLEARVQLADCLVKLGRTEEAVAEYRKLAEILSRTGLMESSTSSPFFMQVHRKLAELDPSNTASREWLAEAYAAADRTEDALAEFDAVAALYEKAKNRPKVVATLRRVVEIFPEQLGFRERLAGLYLEEKGSAAKAKAELAALCQAAEELEDFEIGARAAEKLLEIEPFHMEAHILLAAALRARGEAEAAADRFMSIAQMYLGAGLLGQAEEALKLVLETGGEHAEAHRQLARIAEEREDWDEAAEHYKRAGDLARDRRDLGRAEECYQRALELAPDDAEAADRLRELAAGA